MFFEKMQTRKNDGFTLVELIVVIAILAILAGIGVPAYSGYVEKANMAADQQLVREAANALTLYYYDNYETAASGYIYLSASGADGDAVGQTAMAAVFGEGWRSNALKYGEWANDGIIGSALSPEAAEAVTNSSFVTGDSSVDELLGTVADLTDSAFSFISKKISDPALLYSAMVGNFSTGDAEFKEMCTKYDIPLNAAGNAFEIGSTDAEKTEFQTKLSNMMVFAAAQNFTDAAENDTEGTTAANLLLMYARYTAAVNSNYANDDTKAAYETMNAAFKNANSVEDVQNAMDAFSSNENVATMLENYENDETGIEETDGTALYNIMKAVNASSSKVGTGDLANKNLFTSSNVSNHFNAYLSAAGAVAGGGFPTVSTGDIVLYLSSNGTVVSSSEGALAQ